MQKILEHKGTVLALAIAALLSLVLLTNALSTMDFLPSQPIGGGSTEQVTRPPIDLEELLNTAAAVPFWQQLVFWGALFLLVLLISSLLSPEMRKQLLYAFLRTAVSVLILFYLIKKRREFFTNILDQFSNIGQNLAIAPEADTSPAPVFVAPQEDSWLSFTVGIGVIILLVLLIWWASHIWAQVRERLASGDPLREIAAIARESLSELKSGHNYENAIVECYDRMSEVIARRQGLKREHTMTPSEFATRLTRAGLPRGPIETLTALFEAVRYGRQPAGQTEINQALHSLTSILDYCGEAATKNAA
jgi:hypothetical protein